MRVHRREKIVKCPLNIQESTQREKYKSLSYTSSNRSNGQNSRSLTTHSAGEGMGK